MGKGPLWSQRWLAVKVVNLLVSSFINFKPGIFIFGLFMTYNGPKGGWSLGSAHPCLYFLWLLDKSLDPAYVTVKCILPNQECTQQRQVFDLILLWYTSLSAFALILVLKLKDCKVTKTTIPYTCKADVKNCFGRPRPDKWQWTVLRITTETSDVAVGGRVTIPNREARVTKWMI